MKVQVRWAPRTCYQEADALANGDTSVFTPEFRVPVDPGSLMWKVLPWALDVGREAEKLFLEPKNEDVLLNRTRKQKRRRSEVRLRVTDP